MFFLNLFIVFALLCLSCAIMPVAMCVTSKTNVLTSDFAHVVLFVVSFLFCHAVAMCATSMVKCYALIIF